MRLGVSLACWIFAIAACPTLAQIPHYTLDEAIGIARERNPDIAIAREKERAARSGLVEARSGYLPAVVSNGIYRQRERVESSRLRPEDYDVTLRVVEKIYSGGATTSQLAIARLNLEKAQYQLQAEIDRITMDVRLAFYELLLNRERIHVREQSVDVLQEELKTQSERFSAGTVGELNVRRAEVSLANEEPELIQAQTDLHNSYLRLGELLGVDSRFVSDNAPFEVIGHLVYEQRHPDLNECLTRAAVQRVELKSARKDIDIEDQQLLLDRSATRPRADFFTGYEVYNQRDPDLGREFNHGYIVGLNASWAIFDGFATRARMDATKARRQAARHALEAFRLSIESEVRSAFLDLQQADQVLESETKNVDTANESLQIAKGNLAAGLGTQLDVLQAASDLTRTRSTRLSAIYLHNAALARLDRACGGVAGATRFDTESDLANAQIFDSRARQPR
jgi:outer membrane protein